MYVCIAIVNDCKKINGDAEPCCSYDGTCLGCEYVSENVKEGGGPVIEMLHPA